MASQSRCRQRQPVALDAAYQKPAGGEVAFPMPLVVADELMVVKLRGKLLFWLERLEHILKHPHVTALLLRPLVVLLEGRLIPNRQRPAAASSIAARVSALNP